MIIPCISIYRNHKQYSVLYRNITTIKFKRVLQMYNQPIKLQNVEYQMLLELAKRARMKPEQYISKLINSDYSSKK